MLDQMQKFYMTNYPGWLKGSSDYKSIGEQMYRRYSCIKGMLKQNFVHFVSCALTGFSYIRNHLC